jgi:hypothetical protein
MLISAEQHREIARAIGVDGIELLALRSRLMAQARLGIGAEALKSTVMSQHQSYRGHMIPNSFMQTAEVIGMPRVGTSLKTMRRVQSIIGHKLPVVVYPTEQQPTNKRHPWSVDYKLWKGIFAQIRWQPTAEALNARSLLSHKQQSAARNIRIFGDETGIDKTVLDTHKWPLERDGLSMPAWELTLPELVKSGDCVEMHVCPARTDLGGDTDQLELILNGGITGTEIGDMLNCVRENVSAGDIFDVVLELPHQAIGASNVGKRTWLEVNRDAIAATRGMLV